MSKYFIHNGRMLKQGVPVISAESRGLRYGEGFFETIKVMKGIIGLKQNHFSRIQYSFDRLGFEFSKQVNVDVLELKINQLLIKNNHLEEARVRVMFCRRSGGINDVISNVPEYIIETAPVTIENKLNTNGLELVIYEDAIKPCDNFSNIKSNNYLPYVMAAKYAKIHKANDAILLNMYGRVCDTTIANIFIIKDTKIITPSLSEGCIAGVMRQHIIEAVKAKFDILEKPVTTQELLQADEIFLTNAIKGIRWVKCIGSKSYTRKIVKEIFTIIGKTI